MHLYRLEELNLVLLNRYFDCVFLLTESTVVMESIALSVFRFGR